jgi:hypothetical protein
MKATQKMKRVLLDAANLLEKGAWTQGTLARSKYGAPIDVVSDNAVCYCMIGALYKVSNNRPPVLIFDAIRSALSIKDIAMWNDGKNRKQEEVVQALRKVAATIK